jgi:hypothetical protein
MGSYKNSLNSLAIILGIPNLGKYFSPAPIISKVAPTPTDIGYDVGTSWINEVAGTYFAMTACDSGVATWLSLGGSFTPSETNLTTGAATESSLLEGCDWTATGTDTDLSMTITPKGAGGLELVSGRLTITEGDLRIAGEGYGLRLAEGTNARMGQETLVSGTLAVANTSVSAMSRIFVTRASIGASTALGVLEGVVSDGVGFTITAQDPTSPGDAVTGDASVVNWLLIEAD